MMTYTIDGHLHGTHIMILIDTVHMNAALNALYCKAVFWGYSITGSYILGLLLPIP